MRHIWTFFAALVIAPLVWILLAFGEARSTRAFANAANGGSLHAGDLRTPLLVLAAAGILFGLIGTLRFSPLGAVVAGALYVNSYVMLLIAPDDSFGLFDRTVSIAGRQADLATPIRNGTTLLLGALLLVGGLSVGRWRRRSQATTGPAPQEAEGFGHLATKWSPARSGSANLDFAYTDSTTSGFAFNEPRPPSQPEFPTRYPTASRYS